MDGAGEGESLDKGRKDRYRHLISAREVAEGEKHMTNTRYYIGETRLKALRAFIFKDMTKATHRMQLSEFRGVPVFSGEPEEGTGWLYGPYAVPEMY